MMIMSVVRENELRIKELIGLEVVFYLPRDRREIAIPEAANRYFA